MTPQQLKNSILQLAIQGKLVEQRPEEGTAEDLYRDIQAEKARLAKEGKIKKDKPLPEITDNELPFDIPESWMWVRLGSCSSYAQTKEKITANNIDNSMWSLDLEDIEKETGKIINTCLAGDRKIAGDKVCFYKGQILYSKLRPYLKKILVAPGNGICTPELVPFDTYGDIDAQYIVFVLKSPHVDYVINSVTYGVKMPRVGTGTMTNLLVPLPPLAEQKRIVARIEELLSLVDRYEQAWTQLQALDQRFPADLQKSILQLAIQGRLVEQRPEEGTGEELYREIQAEKARLVKEGKIKKDKPLPEIADDELPFDIPESWKWVRHNELFEIVGGSQPSKSKFAATPKEGYVRLYQIRDYGDSPVPVYVPSDMVTKFTVKGDILLARYGGSLGKVFFAEDGAYNVAMAKVAFLFEKQLICKNYLFYFYLSSLYQSLVKKSSRSAQAGFNREDFVQLLFPLPPLAEQKRIVARIEELLPLCDVLKGKIF